MRENWKLSILILIAGLLAVLNLFIWTEILTKNHITPTNQALPIKQPEPVATPSPTLAPIPTKHELIGGTHSFQTFNNCGPASLSMALSHYDINISQKELGDELRPWQIVNGDNDDKSVTLAEIAEKSRDFGFIPYHRPAGSIELVKQFIAMDIPVITRTNLDDTSDIGHYRVILGYDDEKKVFIQDDSLQGNNLEYSYNSYNQLWKVFNYEFLVMIPESKQSQAEEIIGELVNEKYAWQQAIKLSQEVLLANPNDIYAKFNLAVAYYHLGEYQKSINAYEEVQNKLPFRTLWYQIEPILSYYELGDYDRVFEITDHVLNNHNRAFSELYALRGDIYIKQNNVLSASSEYEKAVFYKQTEEEYKLKLNSLN